MAQDNKVFPMLSNTTCNKELKALADLCGIKTHLTYHVARHSACLLYTSKQDYVLSEKNGKMIPEKVGLKAVMRDGINSWCNLLPVSE